MLLTVFVLLVALTQPHSAWCDNGEIEKVFAAFSKAYAASDFEMMRAFWSGEEDIRGISTTPAGRSVYLASGYNQDSRGWDAVEHEYDVLFRQMHITGSFKNPVIQVNGNEASVIFDSVVWGIRNEGSILLLRKEEDEWKIYMLDFDGLTAGLAGDESGEYAEIAFEAEDADGAADFLQENAEVSKGLCVTGEASCLFHFDVQKASEYSIWCRTYSPSWWISRYVAKMDEEEFLGWGVYSDKWAWSQLNEDGISGPKTFMLDLGEHSFAFSSPKMPGHPGSQGGSMLDAIYITDNLSLRADQIQRRFDLTMGYSTYARSVTSRV